MKQFSYRGSTNIWRLGGLDP